MASAVTIKLRLKGEIQGILSVPKKPEGLILFVHGSGSSRLSPRNQWVAKELQNKNYATLLLDLLTREEEKDTEKVFDCELLANRLMEVALWVEQQAELRGLSVALFGASTGSAAAMIAAAECPHRFQVLISRGGRPDLARSVLKKLRTPTLLIVGQRDELVLRLNRFAFDELKCKKSLEIITGATHLFEEPGKLEEVAKKTIQWLDENLKASPLPFFSRKSAAEQLAKRIKGRVFVKPIVAAIPRGGVETGAVLASCLKFDLGLVLSRKLRHPFFPELAIGAISGNEKPILTQEGLKIERENPSLLHQEIKKQQREIERREKLFASYLIAGKVENRSVILVDDGIATGSTILAAARNLRNQKPQELLLAVPVAARDSLELLREVCDEIICLATPSSFFSVGEFYREFPQIEDEECHKILSQRELKSKKKTFGALSLL